MTHGMKFLMFSVLVLAIAFSIALVIVGEHYGLYVIEVAMLLTILCTWRIVR